MRGMLGIGWLIARALLFTVLVHEAAEALGGGQLADTAVVPEDGVFTSDPLSSDSVTTGPLPQREPLPEPGSLPEAEPLPVAEPTPAPAPALAETGTGAAAFGRTAGYPSVLPTGEAAYSIPLAVPPGTNGLTPQLSLEYRHRAAGGWLGAGWSLGGMSAIARCPRTVAQDGTAGPVRLASTDRFCLDGRRLVVVDGRLYGSAGAEYRTEIESYARVRSYGTAGPGPQYFTVERADGLVAEYGATADARLDWAGRIAAPWAWLLNRLRDRAGNVIDYRYEEDGAQGGFRLASISYNGNPSAGVAPAHQVSFSYESRPAQEVDLRYVAGQPLRQVTRLVRVDVVHAGSLVKRYEFDFEPSLSVAGRSRLAAIRECGRDAAACLASTRLQWQDGTEGLGTEQAYSWSLGGAAWIEEGKRWWVGDVNGDGIDDLVWSSGAPATLRYRLGRRSGSLGAEVDTRVAAPNGAGVPLDYDGDGIGDVLMISAAGRWQVVRGTTSGPGPVVDTGIAANAIDYRGVDLDGNGLSDLAWSENVGFSGNGLVVRVRYNHPGTGFSASPVTLYEQGFEAGYEWAEGGNFLGRPGYRIDLDGDGREDLLMNEEYSIARISAGERMSEAFDSSFAGGVPADVNGDGCTDFAYPHYLGHWRVRLSGCGVAVSYGAELAGPRYEALRHAVQAIDWNGDGKDDLLYADSGSTWKVVRSTGTSLLPALDSGLAHGGPTTTAVGDLDGDGLEDLVTRSGTRAAYRRHVGMVPDLLLSATDGFGVMARFRYAPLTQPGVHARGSGGAYPQQDLQDSRQVVTSLSVSDGGGKGTLSGTSYQYRGLRRELTGRGDAGFQGRTSTPDDSDRPLLEETFHQEFPYVGLPVRQLERRQDGAIVRDTTQSWKALVLGSGAGTRRFAYPASRSERLFEPGGLPASRPYRTTEWSVSTIDQASGVATDRSVVVTEGDGGSNPGARRTERVRVTSLMNDTTNWCLGRPQFLRLTANHSLPGGAELAREQSLAWNGATCRVATTTARPGDPSLQVQVTVEYDPFGNVSRSTVTGMGMAARVTTVDWGARGRFPVRVVQPHQVAWSAAWDEATGALLSRTDANGLVTRFEHDGLGRTVAERLPDGRRTLWSWQACGTTCDPSASYRVWERELDAAGAVSGERRADVDVFDRIVRHATLMPGGGWAEEGIAFDARGRVIRVDRPAWAAGAPSGHLKLDYDGIDRLVGTVLHAPGGSVLRSVRLDPAGLAVRATDPDGRQTLRRFTSWGDVLDVEQPGGAVLRYEHDAFGRLLRVEDETGRSLAELAYDAAGMKTSHKDADLGEWSFNWNALGELLSQRDAKGQGTSFEYDLLGRVLRRTEKEGVTNWAWGASVASRNVGRLLSVSGPGYSESYAYDTYSRLLSRTIKSDTTYQYAFGWDPAGRLASLTYPASTSGFRLRLGYDYGNGAVVRIRDLTAQGRVLWQLTATDAAGNVLDESLGSIGRQVAGYSPVTGELEYQQVLSGSGGVLADTSYRWDDAGSLAERQDHRSGVLERFGYDAAGRLVSVLRNGLPDLGLRYDPAGNITWKSDVCPGATDCFAYDPSRRHAVSAAGNRQYAYDANGNMSGRAGSSVTWYSYNLPQVITSGANKSTFWYGPDRNRWKQVAMEGGVTETTVYVGGLLEKVTRAGKTSWRHYVQAPTGTASVYVRHADGSAPRSYFLTHDHLGGTSAVLDGATGSVLSRLSFDAFGRRRGGASLAGPSAADWSVIRGVTRDGFTGHEHLDNLGLIHMNGRVYDPGIGRFMSADPVVQAPYDRQDLNRYAYGWNNPLNVVDPTGLQEVDCLHGRNGRCQGVTVTGLRQWPAISPAYMALRFGSNGQVVSAAQRDPCGQDGSAEACARSPRSMIDSPAVAGVGFVSGDYWRGFAASLGNLAMNSVPVFWLFGDDPGYEWFHVPDNSAGQSGAQLGTVGYVVGGFAGTIRRAASAETRKVLASTGGVVRRFELPEDRVFYRAYSGDATAGAWLTSVRPRSQSWAQEALALPPWNSATHVQEVLVPRGTLLERSRASQVPDWGRLRGGAEQFKLLETIPASSFGPGSPLP